ncbi:MAG: galactokinase [Lentisphaerae bacterium]|nr:galactokinase [Lentisphaerota bacterium]
MNVKDLLKSVLSSHAEKFSKQPLIAAYAPGRVEILGNHTDYNEGFVLSAAINMGTICAVSKSVNNSCTLFARDMDSEYKFNLDGFIPDSSVPWASYITGVTALLGIPTDGFGFDLTVSTDIPIGAGLSSSAALEVSCGLAISSLYGIEHKPMDLAKICQKAENEYTGTKCGLLDQISSLFGKPHSLIFTDFRTLDVVTIKMPEDICFLMADTGVKHALVDSEYNLRREQCERARDHFAQCLDKPVAALRDVQQDDWVKCKEGLNEVDARRALHVIGENDRVLRAKSLIENGDHKLVGKLMFESHESSQKNFENSCPELDYLVFVAHKLPEVAGARLSGGGFGGSVVAMVTKEDASKAEQKLAAGYAEKYGVPCATRQIIPSAGARLLNI